MRMRTRRVVTSAASAAMLVGALALCPVAASASEAVSSQLGCDEDAIVACAEPAGDESADEGVVPAVAETKPTPP